jgi:hypothetical protein
VPPLPALALLLSRARRTAMPASDGDRWWLEVFGVEAQNDYPAAAYARLGETPQADEVHRSNDPHRGNDPYRGADDAPWMRVDPVHLKLERDQLVLLDDEALQLNVEEAQALAASVAAHFHDHFSLEVLASARWYARPRAPTHIRTVSTRAVRGRGIAAAMPQGEDAVLWHSVMNEAQMLLHDHPVNEAREARGALPVNSLWFWGVGRHRPLSPRPAQSAFGNDPLLRGLAREAGMSAAGLPLDASQWLASAPQNGIAWFALDALSAAADYGDSARWLTQLARLERDWFAPLLAALRSGRIGMITLDIPVTGHGGDGAAADTRSLRCEVSSLDLKRVWRRVKPLAAIADLAKK